MSVIYLADYYKSKTPKKVAEKVTCECGVFSVKYEILPEMPPNNSFGLYSWKMTHFPINAQFYKDELLLFSKEFTRSPSIVIHGDGKTETGTFFTFNEQHNLNVYNMNNEFIKTEKVGADIFVEFKRVNDLYAISLTEEPCTCDTFTGLINLDMFFGTKQHDYVRPYSNSRVHIPLNSSLDEIVTLLPMVATEKGFIVTNKYDIQTSYVFSEENLVTYDDAFNEIVNFYENCNHVDLLSLIGFSDAEKEKIDKHVVENGSVSIDLQNNHQQKDKIFNKLTDAYDKLQEQNKQPIQQTFAMIKPDAVKKGHVNEIMYAIRKNQFKIIDSKEYTFNSNSVDEFYAEHKDKDFFPKLKEFMMSGPVLLLVLQAEDGIRQWRKLIGPTNVTKAKLVAPHTLRAIYGDETDTSKNACHGSDSQDSARREIEFFNNISNKN